MKLPPSARPRAPETHGPLAADWLVGGGEMGARIRAIDWSRTPLGPIESWPQSLRSAVSILLPSKAQIVLFWGPDLITIYNDAYRPVFGAKHPDALGMPARQCWSEVWDVLEPLFQNVITTGEAFWAKDHPFGLERHGYLEETYFDVSYDPIRDETGRVGGLFCIVSETTGRVIGERRLGALRDVGCVGEGACSASDVFRQTAAVLRGCHKDVPFAAIFSGDVRDSSARLEATAGLTAEETPPEVHLELLRRGTRDHADFVLVEPGPGVRLPGGPWPEPAELVAVIRLCTPGKAPCGYLVAGISPRRRFDADYDAFFRLLASAVGNAIVGVRALEDERRRAEALAELDRAKTAFFSNVSHEFRTPLTLILGPLEDLLADPAVDPERGVLLATAHRNSQRLLKLVNTLLDFARIEAGRTQASYVPTDLAVLTTDVASNFRSACERAGLRLTVESSLGPEPVHVDREMWEQIVLNLVSNAFKFTFAGEISLQLRDAGANVELAVRDTGTGIPADALPRLFERFHRVENARGRSHEGSGIGLALVHELVKLHGGSVAVDSRPGAGATFVVSIPKGTAHLPEARVQVAKPPALSVSRAGAYVAEALGWLPPVEPTPARSGRATHRILVADDNADLRDYVRRLLAPDYDVDVVPDGHAALMAAREKRPDLILSDVMMPGLDGFGLIRALRADPALSEIPVVLLSARAGEEARLEGLGRGADDYLVKPFSSRELLVRVGSLVKSASAHRRVAEAREALQEADRRKDEFLATLAHELRNPLAPLRNALEVVKLTSAVGPPPADILQIMDRQLSHLVRLVDDLMEVSRITRGSVELRREQVRLDIVIRNAVEASEPVIRAGKHQLSVSLPDEPIVLDADPVRLAQVFSNLLNNASKYSENGGAIRIEATLDRGEAVVAVSDTGDGIEPDQLRQLFKVFARGTRGAARNQSGLGIGLALVQRLAEMHGGQVTAESEGVGKGSRFTVRLPAVTAQAAASLDAPPAFDAAPVAGNDPFRILVVDDNRDAAASLSLILELSGAETRVAHTGAEALASFASCRPHLVFLDIGMPGMDGYEVVRRLRSSRQEPRAAIVALTGWGQPDDRQRVQDAGFDHHLIKPPDLAALKSLIASVQANRGTQSSSRPQ